MRASQKMTKEAAKLQRTNPRGQLLLAAQMKTAAQMRAVLLGKRRGSKVKLPEWAREFL